MDIVSILVDNIFSVLILVIQVILFLKLEKNKKEFQKELDTYKIEYSEIQLKKIEYFNEFIECLIEAIIMYVKGKHDDEKLKNMSEKLDKLQPYLFMYASDETIRKINKCIEDIYNSELSDYGDMCIISELIIALRKDIGYEKTELDADDLLKMILAPSKYAKLKSEGSL
ncbi:hypothetical protein [Methanococcus maripaludis]|uniref:Uncharacterized protein n=1 Tax=Methanococcus maripaludis TaxID=39152 RepID=A0A7J9PNP6_METMI|nr:hypothetical protein [Methanococcus maripaludis]MBA2864913.1 hypothetical protein [Methanococcus maripaludis]